MQKKKIGSLIHTMHKNELKVILDLNLRAKAIKLLQESINLHNLALGNGFLDMTPKAQATTK